MSLASQTAAGLARLATAIKAVEARTRPVDLVGDLRWPLYIAHRGGGLAYPESSMEAFQAAHASGYTPEADVQTLADGTLVCIHDVTCDRTMTITGRVDSKNITDWRNARVKPAVNGFITGTGYGTPVTFGDYLDEFGGRTVLIPELKVLGADVDRAIQMVLDRGLQRSVILQSFSVETCRKIVAAGIEALYLTNSATAASIVADGINYAGPPKTATNTYINSLKTAGLKVIVYTVTSKAEADTQLARGADGVFCDDPWEASRRTPPATALHLDNGHIPPGSAFARDNSGKTPANTTGRAEIDRGTLSLTHTVTTDNHSGSIRLGAIGYGGPDVRLTFWAQSLGPQSNTGAWFFGLYLGKQSGASPVNEEPGDGSWRLVLLRRDGRKQVYEKRSDAGSTSSLGVTTAPTTPYASGNGRSIPMLFEIEYTATGVTVRNLTLGDADLTVSHSSWSADDLYLSLRVTGAQLKVWDVRASRP